MEALLFLLFALFSIISSLMERRKRKREVELAREKQKERSERQENEIEEDIFTEFRDVPDDEVIAQSTEEIKSGSVPDLVVRDNRALEDGEVLPTSKRLDHQHSWEELLQAGGKGSEVLSTPISSEGVSDRSSRKSTRSKKRWSINASTARDAIVYSEILGKPKSERGGY